MTAASHRSPSLPMVVLALGLVNITGGAFLVGQESTASSVVAGPVFAQMGVIKPRTAAMVDTPMPTVSPQAVYDPIMPEQLLPLMGEDLAAQQAAAVAEAQAKAAADAAAAAQMILQAQAAAQAANTATTTDQSGSEIAGLSLEQPDLSAAPAVSTITTDPATGEMVLSLSVDDANRVMAASLLKDVTPFDPSSGANTNNRYGEWVNADRSIRSLSSVRAYTIVKMAEYGWGVEEWPALDRLWWHESGWSPVRSDGDTSRAWGIPQALPASKMAAAGDDYLTNPITQVNWGLAYISQRYGSPSAAWNFWKTQALNGQSAWY